MTHTPADTAPAPALRGATPARDAAPPEGPACAQDRDERIPTKFTREQQVVFLRALADSGQVRHAARAVGISHTSAYRQRHASPDFATAWDAALVLARHHAEEVLETRAIHGIEEEVWYHGEVVGTRRRLDARLLLAHLARLDRLEERGYVREVAGEFDEALARFACGDVLHPYMLVDDPDLEERRAEQDAREAAEAQAAEWRAAHIEMEAKVDSANGAMARLEDQLAQARGAAALEGRSGVRGAALASGAMSPVGPSAGGHARPPARPEFSRIRTV